MILKSQKIIIIIKRSREKEFCYANFCPWKMMKHRCGAAAMRKSWSWQFYLLVEHNGCTVSHLSSNNLGGRTCLARKWFHSSSRHSQQNTVVVVGENWLQKVAFFVHVAGDLNGLQVMIIDFFITSKTMTQKLLLFETFFLPTVCFSGLNFRFTDNHQHNNNTKCNQKIRACIFTQPCLII